MKRPSAPSTTEIVEFGEEFLFLARSRSAGVAALRQAESDTARGKKGRRKCKFCSGRSTSLNLTSRIFLMTGALIVAACAITYGAIAYLTPITYTSILRDELDQKSRALIEALEKTAPEESEALLADFVRNTGAELTVWDERGNALYGTAVTSGTGYALDEAQIGQAASEDSAPAAAERGNALYGTAVTSGTGYASDEGIWIGQAASEDAAPAAAERDAAPSGAAESDAAPSGAASSSESEDTAYIVEDTTVIAEDATATTVTNEQGGLYSFAFADGTNAMMNVTGGVRAVNQAAEALGRVLPFLIGVVLLISLAGSFFYARFITRPIVSISRIARRMAALDFEARWDKRRSDEIGALGGSLNLLSDNLSGALRQLKDANQTLRRDIDRERELDRQRLAFFSAVSHELKTPVTILKGQLGGMLAQVGIYRDREKYLARALEVTGRMEGLVKEILTINRIESGGFTLKAKAIDLADLMKKQLELDEELIEQKSLALETHLASGVIIQGDEALLTKVLDNVLINAILYSPPGASIYVEVDDQAFSVENTGATIPEESLAQLFTPFYRVEQSRSRKSGGSGLGLYLVKTILDRHGASCRIENTSQGVRFSARFP